MPFDLKNYKGGWIADKLDIRDFAWHEYFGAITPTNEELPKEFSHRDKLPKILPYQGSISSCTSCSVAFLQAYHQKQEHKQEFRLSWRDIYANVPKYANGGTTFRDNAEFARKFGIAKWELCEDRPEMGFAWVTDLNNISEEAKQSRAYNSIKSYSFPSWTDFKRALWREPLIIAVDGNSADWSAERVKNNGYIVKRTPNSPIQWAHAIVATGWRDKGTNWWEFEIEFANWWGQDWGDKGFAWLEVRYGILAMMSLEDLPNLKKSMLRILKTKDDPACWLVNDKLKTKQQILIASVYRVLTLHKENQNTDWSMVETVEQSELDKYETLPGKIIAGKV